MRDPLQMGLVPWTLEGWLKQHQRWTTSNMEILNIIWNKILFSRGRYSLRQKWIIMAWAMQQLLMPFTFMLSWVQMAAMVVMSNKDLGPAVWLHDGVLFRISLVIGVIATMLQDAVALLLTADVPWAFSMFVRGKVALAFESPYKTLWVVRFLLRLPAGWSPTGNLLKRSQLLSHIKLCWYHLLVAVSAVAVTTYSIISALSFCRNPFQLGLRIFGVASMVLGFPLTLLPALFYM